VILKITLRTNHEVLKNSRGRSGVRGRCPKKNKSLVRTGCSTFPRNPKVARPVEDVLGKKKAQNRHLGDQRRENFYIIAKNTE